jgi:SNF2 family DNA or RNA helicase
MKKYKFKTKPFDHQLIALDKSWSKKVYALFMEMGTGKTKVIIDNIGILKQQNEINIAVIVAPKSVYLNWENEFNTHLSDEVPYKIYAWNRDKNETEVTNAILDNKLGVYLINVEALSHQSGVKFLKDVLLRYRNSIMVIDESTTIKNQSAIRSKNILKLSQTPKYKRVLTGSPVTKSPLDLYTQCNFLSPDLLGFTSYYTFRARYAVMDQIRVGQDRFILAPKYYTNLEELEGKLKTFSYRVRKDECLDLPEKIRQQRIVDLTLQQRKTYDELKQRALAIIEDDTVSFNNKLTELLRLHQISNGFLKDDSGVLHSFPNCPKLKELLNIIEETEDKVIIWANYVYNIETIMQTLEERYGKNSTVAIYGEIDTEDRQKAVQRFQEDPSCRFFVGNPSTGGFGLTLTAASYVIYFSNNFNLEVRQQSEDRAHRIGQKRSVTYIDILTQKTVDEHILKALQSKLTISAKTLGENVRAWLC